MEGVCQKCMGAQRNDANRTKSCMQMSGASCGSRGCGNEHTDLSKSQSHQDAMVYSITMQSQGQ